jgi:hypothetical protein
MGMTLFWILHLFIGYVSKGAYDKDKVLASMQLMETLVTTKILRPAPNPVSLTPGQSRLQRIKKRGIIRIGYDADRLPFSYTNVAGNLVGYELDMAQRLAHELGVTIELVVLDSYRDFFEQTGPGKNLDALYTGAESGSAWTLLYPNFQVVTPWSDDYKVPLVYPYSGDVDNQMDEFMDHWVLLKQHDGTTGKAFRHWILGTGSEKKEPRWSVIRNVLGWVD